MRSEDIFALGLGLTPPWEVSKVEFVQEPDKSKTLHIYIDFRKGEEFVYDAGQKQRPMTRKTRCGATSTFSSMSAISIAVCRAL